MCGIFGVISRTKTGMFNDELAFLRQAFIAGATRGEDSAGAFMVPSADPHSVEWVKKAGEPFHLLYHKDFKDLFERTDKGGRVLVGHNRYATKGSVSDANAHPFNVGPITLVHNGTIHSGLNYPKGIDVDSHALAHALAEEGIEVFSKINGAFACVWHDARTGHLHIAKNYERPLSMIESYGTYFFASEAPMLLWLFHRNQSGYYNNYKKFNSVEIKNNKLYTFNLTADDPVPIEEPLPEKKYYPTTTYQGSTTTCGTTTESSKACGPHKEKRNRKTSRASDDSVTFEIKEVITNDGNKFSRTTWKACTSTATSCWNSKARRTTETSVRSKWDASQTTVRTLHGTSSYLGRSSNWNPPPKSETITSPNPNSTTH